MGLHVVVGAGPVGSGTASLLAEAGETVRVVSRGGKGPAAPGIECLAADAGSPGALTAIATGADAIYNCANPPYPRWATDWPPLAAAMLDAAERTGAVLVTASNLYGYGPVDHPLTETDPLAATSTNGRVRAEMWKRALAAHRSGRVRVTEARSSDYFGPGLTDAEPARARHPPHPRGQSRCACSATPISRTAGRTYPTSRVHSSRSGRTRGRGDTRGTCRRHRRAHNAR